MSTSASTAKVAMPPALPSALFMPEHADAYHLLEFAMREISYRIRSKPEWWLKIKDNAIPEKWRDEIKQQRVRGFKLEDEHIDWIFDELKDYANARSASGIQAGLMKAFWESDNLVDADLKNKLEEHLAVLRDVPDDEKDWHPGSDKQVLDLIHPSMYCLRYGKSIRKDGSPVPAPPLRDSVDWRTIQNIWDGPLEGSDESLQHAGLSKTTSWLPTDFTVSEDGKHLKALSYINNVHPLAHAKLQDVLVELLEAFLPMFERTAGDLTSYIDGFPRLFGDEQSELDDSTRPVDPKTGEPIESWNDEEDEDDERWETWLETLPYIDPKPKPYEPLASPLGSGFRLNGRTIQVIVKVAEIHLTPEKPNYDGGSWHLEGMLNESIVATGIYYLASENITPSKLSFRVGISSEGPNDYEQEDPSKLLLRSYGLERDSPMSQFIGSFEAREGRSIVFPNLYQHKVEPFSLLDPAKPGRRSIIAFFLCDPTYKVVSTTDVAPQQAEWVRGGLHRDGMASFDKLAPELKDQIIDNLINDEVILDRKKAEEVRELLMKERSHFQVTQNDDIYESAYRYVQDDEEVNPLLMRLRGSACVSTDIALEEGNHNANTRSCSPLVSGPELRGSTFGSTR